jgi:plasmid stability protein
MGFLRGQAAIAALLRVDECYHCYHLSAMPQLLVRDIETAVVRKLRSSAAAQGVSVEEAHRRLLRSALIGNNPDPKRNFIEYLRSIPQGEGVQFLRAGDRPRQVEL